MIVLDSSDFGWMMDALVDYIKENGLTHWYIFRPDSFEGYLLRTKFVNVSTECTEPVYNIEDMWTKKLNKVLPLLYTKGNLSKCIKLECGDKTLYKCDGCKMRTKERKRDLVVCGVLARVIFIGKSKEEHG